MYHKILPVFFVVEQPKNYSKEQLEEFIEFNNNLGFCISTINMDENTYVGVYDIVFSKTILYDSKEFALHYNRKPYKKFKSVNGPTNYEYLFCHLNKILGLELLKLELNLCQPIIFFITQGSEFDFSNSGWLKILNDNENFSYASKVVINLGEDKDFSYFKPLVGELGYLCNVKEMTYEKISRIISNIIDDHYEKCASNEDHLEEMEKDESDHRGLERCSMIQDRKEKGKGKQPKILKEIEEIEEGRDIYYSSTDSYGSDDEYSDYALEEDEDETNFIRYSKNIDFEDVFSTDIDRMIVDNLIKEGERNRQREENLINYALMSEKNIKKNSNFLITFTMYTPFYKYILNNVAGSFKNAQMRSKGQLNYIEDNSEITIELYSPNDKDIYDEETFLWNNKYQTCYLNGFIKEDYAPDNIILGIKVIVNGVKITTLKVLVDLKKKNLGSLLFSKENVEKIFFSYAHDDQKIVFDIVDKINNIFFDNHLDYFLDVDKLRAGENWKKRLFKEIDDRDTFCLIWSKSAYQSEWVNKEWNYALKKKGLDAINPINLDAGNDKEAPIPKKLKDIHFVAYPTYFSRNI